MIDLEIKDLKKSFGRESVLKGLSFSVNSQSLLAIIGSNGAGKSTLLRCCSRLIEPSSGSIKVFDKEITNLNSNRLRQIRRDVGFIFQRHNLVPRLSVLSNVIHGDFGNVTSGLKRVTRWFHFLSPQASRSRAMDCLRKVNLSHLAMKRVDTLSGGQSQRVAIARVLMQKPKLLLADEPVASLDPVAAKTVMELLTELCKKEKITVIFTSHNVEDAVKYSDKILALKDGEISFLKASKTIDPKKLIAQYDSSVRFV